MTRARTHSPHQTDREKRRNLEARQGLDARQQIYIRRGRRALLTAMLVGDGTTTEENVFAAVKLPADSDPRCLKTVPGRLAYDGIIRPAGYIRAGAREKCGDWLQVWRLADRAAAERWLREHPDQPDATSKDSRNDRKPTTVQIHTNTNPVSPSVADTGKEHQL